VLLPWGWSRTRRNIQSMKDFQPVPQDLSPDRSSDYALTQTWAILRFHCSISTLTFANAYISSYWTGKEDWVILCMIYFVLLNYLYYKILCLANFHSVIHQSPTINSLQLDLSTVKVDCGSCPNTGVVASNPWEVPIMQGS
jgi:hypothetical protein